MIEFRGTWRPRNKSPECNPPAGVPRVEVVSKCVLSKNVLVHHRARTTHSGAHWVVLLVATPRKMGNLHTCRFLQPYHDASNLLICLTTPFVWLIVLPTAAIITIFKWAVGSLVVRASEIPHRKAWVRCPMLQNTLRVHTEYVLVKSVGPKVLWAESRVPGTGEYFPPLQFHAKIVELEIGGIAIYRPFGNFAEQIRTVTCKVLKAKTNDRRTSSPLLR
ncbi:uncharacterized protein TNCV_862611 [Trichonephila clavipes]|nr:uncharacterized protein TNCV_862611 [Trichonephila clavipes]